jgi:hypothetical protein
LTTRGQNIALAVWTLAFLIGASNHARELAAGGWLPYRFAPIGCNIFWTTLLPIDVAVAALLWLRRAIGLWLGLAVMIADVVVNSWVVSHLGFVGLASSLQLQTLFLGFVIGSIGWLLPRRGRV